MAFPGWTAFLFQKRIARSHTSAGSKSLPSQWFRLATRASRCCFWRNCAIGQLYESRSSERPAGHDPPGTNGALDFISCRVSFGPDGYNVVFQPLIDGKPSGPYVVFADGFAGAVKEPGRAAYRPSGLTVGPDGAVYVGDDLHGRIW